MKEGGARMGSAGLGLLLRYHQRAEGLKDQWGSLTCT